MILVTGADGFIGSHLVEALIRRGERVRAFCQYNSFGSTGWLDLVSPRLEVVLGDVRDRDFVFRSVEGCGRVLHLAALIGIPYSYDAPESYFATNLGGTLNVLQACRKHDVRRAVVTSTSEVYGTAQAGWIDESHPLEAQSPYAASKIAADHLALSFHRSFGLPVAILRPFNTYGPRQSQRAVLPTIIGQALQGDDVTIGSALPVRDMMHVLDTVNAFLALLDSDLTGVVLNAGTGRTVSVLGMATLVGEILGRKLRVISVDDRLRPAGSEVWRLACDASRLKALTGWAPTYDLKDGLRDTIAWFKANPPRIGGYAV